MRTFLLIVVLAALAIGGFLYFGGEEAQAPGDENATTTADTMMDGESGMNGGDAMTENGEPAATITYTTGGFNPTTTTVNVGDTVTFVNEGEGDMWVASDVHPTHELYNDTTLSEHCSDGMGSTFDQCSVGQEYSFTFEKAGEWAYHNHVRSSHVGVIVVEEQSGGMMDDEMNGMNGTE